MPMRQRTLPRRLGSEGAAAINADREPGDDNGIGDTQGALEQAFQTLDSAHAS